MPPPLRVVFAAGPAGPWRIERIAAITGPALPTAERLAMSEGEIPTVASMVWRLDGTTSNARYTSGAETAALSSRQETLRRPHATRAALIPIRKSPAWWELAQDERRAVFEEQSHHIAIGMEVLPAVARRLHHARDLGGEFDFLTWFEYAPQHEAAFDTMLERLRATAEWRYVEREVDIRLSR